MQKTLSPEFSALMAQYRDTRAGLGDDHPITRRLWILVEHTAPPWFQDEMRRVAKDMGLIPQPRMCNDDGEPMFSVAELASHMGMSIEEAEAAIERLIADRRASGLPVDGFRKVSPDQLHTMQ